MEGILVLFDRKEALAIILVDSPRPLVDPILDRYCKEYSFERNRVTGIPISAMIDYTTRNSSDTHRRAK